MKYVENYNASIDINTVIMAPSTGLATAMRSLTALPEWRMDYRHDHAVIFVRNHPI